MLSNNAKRAVDAKKTIQVIAAAVVLFWAVSCLGQSREAVMASKGEDELSEPKQVALTFDDGLYVVYTPKLLNGLRQRDVHAAFFLIGDSIGGKEDIIRQMKADGHLIGNYTSNHVQLTKKNEKEACDKVNRTNQEIYDIAGEWPEYIRPLFGSWGEELECIVPVTVASWNIDSLDWKTQNAARVINHVLKHVDDGDIILFHDIYGTPVDAALQVVDILTKQDYTFVTVGESLVD